MTAKRLLMGLGLSAISGLGVVLGMILAGSATTNTRTVTRAVTGPERTRTVTRIRTMERVRTIERVRTRVKIVAAPRPAAPGGNVPTVTRTPTTAGRSRPMRFSGTGTRVLGTITLGASGATLRWTNSGGRFRLLFDGNSLAVDSTAHSGEIAAPPLTYRQVTVRTPGRWTIQIG
jgi:hypothetical protein